MIRDSIGRVEFPLAIRALLSTSRKTDQVIGIGDGVMASFGLCKTYASGGRSYERAIVKPVAGTVRVAAGGKVLAEGVDWDVDLATGIVTISSQAGSVGIRATTEDASDAA